MGSHDLGLQRVVSAIAAITRWHGDGDPRLPGLREELAALTVHGTRYTYTHGCRCDPCTAANLAYQNERNRRKRTLSL